MIVERHLQARGPIDAGHLLAFLGAHAVPGVETWDAATYARTLALPNGAATATLSAADDGVRVTLHCDPGDTDEAVRRLTHLCGLDDDPSEAEAALVNDPMLRPLIRQRPGVRGPGSVDHAETLVRTVVGQQVSLAGASAAAGRIVAAAGTPLGAAGHGLTHLFPTPCQLAALDPETLPMPRARGRCVVGVALALAHEPALVEDDGALLALPGVGPWTVDYTRFRTRRDPDVLLAGDLAVRRQVETTGRVGTPDAVRTLSAAWSPYRSTAMMHLWAAYLDRSAR